MEFHAWLITDIHAQQRKHMSSEILKQNISHLMNETSPKTCKFLQGMSQKSCKFEQGSWEKRKKAMFKENSRSFVLSMKL